MENPWIDALTSPNSIEKHHQNVEKFSYQLLRSLRQTGKSNLMWNLAISNLEKNSQNIEFNNNPKHYKEGL